MKYIEIGRKYGDLSPYFLPSSFIFSLFVLFVPFEVSSFRSLSFVKLHHPTREFQGVVDVASIRK